MKKIIWSVVIGLLLITGLNIDKAVAQSPPGIRVSLALIGSRPDVPDRLVYLAGDPITMVLMLKNYGGEEITSEDFNRRPFHLFLIFTDPDGKGIIAKKLLSEPAEDAPPPPIVFVEDRYFQVEPVDTIPATWILTIDIPNAHAYYDLLKPGNYSVKAIISMRTYLSIDHTISSLKYSEIDRFKWQGHLESKPVHFTLLADADGDGYYYPEPFGQYDVPDCNDNDPNEHPNQTWYKDEDNDGYSDGTTNTASCTRPQDYKLASELTALSGDCDDNNPLRNPGKTEITCNGLDDDCNPATPDIPAPTLASPPNGATNVSSTPTLSWNASSCVTNFGLQVAKDSSFPTSSIVVDQSGITSTSYTLASPLANNTTYYWRVNAKNSGETSFWSEAWSFTTMGPTGIILVKAVKYTIGLGHHPSITESPIVGMPVKVFAKSPGSCAAQYGIISWPHYKEIWDNCPMIASGATNVYGKVTFSVPPGTYIVIGKYDPNPSQPNDEKYMADNVFGLKAGETRQAFLPFIVLATGKGHSCKYTQQTGSNLLIIEPEHVEWDGEQEQYPFAFQGEGDWTVETSVTPPEGFVADYSSLSADVKTSLKSIQFTLTDIGSKWKDTQVKHRIKHKGKWKTINTKIGVKLSEKLAKKRGLTVFGEKIKK
jgi:hypothetical protein